MSINPTNTRGKGFDHLASFYDICTRILSLNNITKSQLAFISKLSFQKKGLILGGGTGLFLQKLLEENKNIEITYVDFSSKMIDIAKKRIKKNNAQDLNRVTFICKAVENFELEKYDLIVCNYLLDMLDTTTLTVLSSRLKVNLNTDGILYVTDFRIPKKNRALQWCTQTGLKTLYLFFNNATHLQIDKLPEINTILKQKGFKVIHKKDFFFGILRCTIYS